jgi:hypothetical protein
MAFEDIGETAEREQNSPLHRGLAATNHWKNAPSKPLQIAEPSWQSFASRHERNAPLHVFGTHVGVQSIFLRVRDRRVLAVVRIPESG